MAVHPQLLPTAADSMSEYDVYGPHVSRMITAVGVSSDHLENPLDDLEIVRAMLGATDAEVTIAPGSGAPRVLGDRVRASLEQRTGPAPSHLTAGETPAAVETSIFPPFLEINRTVDG